MLYVAFFRLAWTDCRQPEIVENLANGGTRRKARGSQDRRCLRCLGTDTRMCLSLRPKP